MILIDTNVLLQTEEARCDQHEAARRALHILFSSKALIGIIFPQIIAEYWSICTRPQREDHRGGFGWTNSITSERAAAWEKAYTLFRDKPEIYDRWRYLITHYNVKGKKVHDARLVAAMLVHDIGHILTFNGDDFKRFDEITVLHPDQIDENFILT